MTARPTLLIGCPVRRRERTIQSWVHHVVAATSSVEMDVAIVLVGDAHDPSIALARTAASRAGVDFSHITIREPGPPPPEHMWPIERIRHMVAVRNRLLRAVRRRRPALFLSVDSDILMHEAGIASLAETLAACGFDAVGGKAYMTPHGRYAPNYANIASDGALVRQDCDGIRPVHAIMAVKLMSPAAYGIDYRPDPRGEDIGWSLAGQRQGLRLGWDGRVINEHLMRDSLPLTTTPPQPTGACHGMGRPSLV